MTKNISKNLDDEYSLDIIERERLSGYNNAIIFLIAICFRVKANSIYDR